MVSGIFDPKCPRCGNTVSRQAKFCGTCGFALSGGKIACGVCGAENSADAKFCRNCGRLMSQAAAPEIQHHHWARNDGDFAVRIEANDLPGMLQRGLIVEPGTNALFIERGVNRGVVPPGAYGVEGAGQKLWNWASSGIPEQATVLLVSVTPAELQFSLGGRFTRDPLPIGLTVRLQVEVTEPARVLINLLGGRERYTLEDLRQYLYPEVVQAADDWLRKHSLQELAEQPGQREALELALEQSLQTTFSQSGLRFLQARTVELNLEPYDKVSGIRGKYALWTLETTTAFEGRRGQAALSAEVNRFEEDEKDRQRREDADRQDQRTRESADRQDQQAREALDRQEHKDQEEADRKARYADLKHQIDLQALTEETRSVELQEKRIELHERVRQAVMSDKMKDVRSEADFERFLEDIDQEKVLREKERADLQQTWKEAKEDHDLARAQVLAKLDIEQEFEKREMFARLQYAENMQAMNNDIELARKYADAALELRRKNVDEELRLEHQRREDERERAKYEEEHRQHLHEIERLNNLQKEEDARKARELDLEDGHRARQLEREDDRADAGFAVDLLKQLNEIDQKEQENRQALDRLDKSELLRIQREDELTRMKTVQELELAKMEAEERHTQAAREHELQLLKTKDEQVLKTQQSEQDYQLERMRLAANLGPDALISVSGVEQARILADLKKSEALKGMSDEQILAMAAQNSPEVARAFQEKFRAAAAGQLGQELKEMYERLMKKEEEAAAAAKQDKEDAERRSKETADQRVREVAEAWEKSTTQTRATMDRAMDSHDRAMDRMADLGKAFAESESESPIIINTPPGFPQVVYPVGGAPIGPGGVPLVPPPFGHGEMKTCPKCGWSVPVKERFCEHCGLDFPGMS
jgi:hypothetical protein